MADFNLFLPKLLASEGGYVNHPSDPGGATNKGITWNTFQGTALAVGIQPTWQNFINLTDEWAALIYKKFFWDPIKGDFINNQSIAEIIADANVNHPYTAVRIAQKVAGVPDDNIVGPVTLNALNSVNPDTFSGAYYGARQVYYSYRANDFSKIDLPENFIDLWVDYFQSLGIASSSSMQVFLNGWLNRISKYAPVIAAGGGLVFLLIGLTFLYFKNK